MDEVEDLIRVGGGESNFGILRTFAAAGIEHQYKWNHGLGEAGDGSLQVGVRAHFERFQDNAGNGSSPDARTGEFYRANNYETYAYSVFALEELRLDELIITPGVRLELFEQEMVNRLNGNKLNDATVFAILPGIGFNYQLEKVNIFGGLHRGMTPPSNGTLLTLNFGETDDSDFEGLELKPESSWNSEIGFRTNRKWVETEIALFRITIEDMIAAARGTSFINLGSINSQGVESSVRVKASYWSKYLPTLFMTYTYLDTEIESGILRFSALEGVENPDVSGNELPYAPRHNLIVGLNYSLLKKARLMINYRYVSRSYSDYENIEFISNRGDTGPIPAFWLFNTSLNIDFSSQFNCFIAVKNILDKKYIGSRLHSNPRSQFAAASSGILPGAERQINIGINYKF